MAIDNSVEAGTPIAVTPPHRTYTGRIGGLLFAAALLAMCLVTHGRMTNEGYEGEVLKTVTSMVENHKLTFVVEGENVYYRNGLTQPLLSLPLYYIGRTLQNVAKPLFSREWGMQLFMPFISALTVLFIYRFALLLGHRERHAGLLGLFAAFATMLFPYSIFGMEPPQTFFTLAAVFYLYWYRRDPAWWSIGMAGVMIALLYPAKRASPVVVVPVVLYALYVLWQNRRGRPSLRDVLLFVVPVVLSFAGNAWFNSLKPTSTTNQFHLFNDGLVTNGVIGYWLSPGKSYFLYCPVAVLALFGAHNFWRRQRAEAVLFGGIIAACWLFFAQFHFWADETWGPRYFHVITPFMVLVAGGVFPLAARTPGVRWWHEKAGRRRAAIVALFGFGVVVNFLGSIFYYGAWPQILTEARLDTFDNMQYNPDLNNIWLNLLVLLSGISKTVLGRPIYFVHAPGYWPNLPADVGALNVERRIDLSRFAQCDLWVCKVALLPDYDPFQKAIGLGLWLVIVIAFAWVCWRLWRALRQPETV